MYGSDRLRVESMDVNAGKRTNPVPWPAWIPIVAGAFLLGFYNDALGGWGLACAVGTGVVLLPVLQYRRYWHSAWFWLTMAAISIAQIPLIIFVKPAIDQFKVMFDLIFGAVDLCLVVLVVNWVRPKEEE